MLLILALACGRDDYEGDGPNECTDEADNDRDGYFDCNDNGCWNHPECLGEGDSDTDADADSDSDADADSDSDTDSDTDTDVPDIGTGLSSVWVDYQLDWVFNPAPIGLENCVQTYRGEGTYVEVSGARVTFDGTWERTSSTCVSALDDLVWVDESGEAYTSLLLDGTEGSPTHVIDWVVHAELGDNTLETADWWVSEMDAPWDALTYTEDEVVPEYFLILTHTWSAEVE
ncbi:MAG: hypothetical protein GY913_01950 [Proteobacteria bacterium]|nr:hypothetical protein [Pseudomonadota bacterium]MCP4915661.1 hypothetical protein [Pseudomonadota bacterium]